MKPFSCHCNVSPTLEQITVLDVPEDCQVSERSFPETLSVIGADKSTSSQIQRYAPVQTPPKENKGVGLAVGRGGGFGFDTGLGFAFAVGCGVGSSEIGAGKRRAVISKSTTARSGMSVRFKERILSRNNKQSAGERIFDLTA